MLGGVVHALLGGQPQHGEEAHDEEGEEGAEGAIEPPQHDGGHAEGHEVGHEVVADVAVPAHRSACLCVHTGGPGQRHVISGMTDST